MTNTDNFSKESYDRIYSRSNKYKLHYKLLRFYPVWYAIASTLNINDNIIDIGCGPGHLAELLFDIGVKNYTGIDFSNVAIKQAKLKVPDFNFVCEDVTATSLFENINKTYISTEAFEHFEDDKKLIKRLKRNSKLFFSVPSFSAPNHYRTYKTEDFIINYYQDILQIQNIEKFYQNEKDIIFVVKSIIK